MVELLKKLPKISIEKPMLMIPVIIVMIASGIITYSKLPKELQPYLENPTVGIVIQYPGVAAEDMEMYFARPIEQKMSVLNDVTFIRSNSQEGRTEVIIGFEYGSDMNRSKVDVQTLLSNMLNELPFDRDNTTNPWVVHVANDNVPILDLNISRKGYDGVRLREFVENVLRDEIEKIDGVQSAIPYGGKRRQVIIEVDRDKLAAYRLGLMDIKTAIEQQYLSRAAGKLRQQENEFLVRATMIPEDPSKLGDIPVSVWQDKVVYLRDVAQVKDTHAEETSAYHYNGKRGQLLMVVKQPEASDFTVIDKVLKKMDEFVAEYPGLSFQVAYNRKDFLETIIENAWHELMLAFIITGLVVLVFIRTVTPTFIVLLTLPAAMAASFSLFPLGNLTINTPTLMGITFVLGRLVDDSVVLIEVINRHLKMGKPPKQAALHGSYEILLPNFLSAATFMIALTPNLMLGGSMGTGFRGMTFPMIMAMAFSTFLSFTLNPMMAAYLYKPYKEMLENPIDQFLGRILSPFRWLIDQVVNLYRHVLPWALDHRVIVVALGLASMYVAYKIWPTLGWEGMPLQDTAQAVGEAEAWPGTSLQETEKIVSRIEEILVRQPETRKVSTQIGLEPAFGTYFSGYGVRTINRAFFKITFANKEERVCQFYHRWLDPIFHTCRKKTGRDIWEIMDGVQQEALASIPGIRSFWLMEMGAAPVNTARAPIEAVVKGPDLHTLARIGEEGKQIAERTPGVVQPFTSWSMSMPQYHLVIDRVRAKELGLAVPQIAMQAYYALNGGMTSEFFKPEGALGPQRHSRFLIRYRPEQRQDPSDLANVMITTPKGDQVPLREVARFELQQGTDLIYKEDLQYAMSVLGQYRGVGLKMATAGVVMGIKTSVDLPKGYTVQPKGMMLDMLDNVYRLYGGLALALFFLLVLLLLQTQSWVATLAILMDAPLEVFGAIYFLRIRGFYWSPPVIWGLTIATAAVMATGIYLTDKIEAERRSGKSRRDAILTAGPIRLIPVLMTAITFTAAFIPPMFAPPTGMDRFRPIATALVGAMISSTALSLIVVPVFYSIFDDVKEFLFQVYSAKPAPRLAPAPVPALELEEALAPAGMGGDGENLDADNRNDYPAGRNERS
ncbi:MAG: efflux RND transporter permease subunit [Gemmatimonadetes bacterium]|nr:efflux RND transporter permease subunit [Gemmatimonadota bacterium]